MNIKFENPYRAEKNLLISLYSNWRPSVFSTKASKNLAYLISVVLRRIFFSLMKNGFRLESTATVYGRSFNFRTLNSQFHSIYFEEYLECYEPEVFSVIDLFLPKNGVLVDVGSNWGHHSFLSILKKNARVIAFEPNLMVFSDLESIAEQLEVKDKLVAFNCGLGSQRGQFDLRQSRFESGLASISSDFNNLVNRYYKLWPERLFDKLTLKQDLVQRAEIFTLDSKLSELNGKIDLIKLDCEGVELSALYGAKEAIGKDRPKIVFEIHSDASGKGLDEFHDFFGPLNYTLYEITANLQNETCKFKKLDSLEPNKWYNILASNEELS